MSRGTLDPAFSLDISVTGLSPSSAGFPKTVLLCPQMNYAVRTPECTHSGLASFPFARRYLGNRCFFLFLRLLRCFSSPGSPPYVMDSRMDDTGLPYRVSPFRNPRMITGMCPSPRLIAAYHVFLRLSVPRHPPRALLT